MSYDFDAIRDAFPVASVLDHFGLKYSRERRCPCPLCGTGSTSTAFRFNGGGNAPHLWTCFACGAGGDAIGLFAALGGLSRMDAAREIAGMVGLAPESVPPDVALTRRIARELIRERADAAKTRERLRLNALAVRAYHAERAGRWYREAARLTPDRDEALPLVWAALAAEEVAEGCDRELERVAV